MDNILDPLSIPAEVYAQVFSEAGLDELLVPSDQGMGFKFVDKLTDQSEVQSLLMAFSKAIMYSAVKAKEPKELHGKIVVATATAMWLGYQLAQAQLAALQTKQV
jgi:hypothetical protein